MPLGERHFLRLQYSLFLELDQTIAPCCSIFTQRPPSSMADPLGLKNFGSQATSLEILSFKFGPLLETIVDTISLFTKEVSKWSRENFENVFYKKKKLLARFEGIQKCLQTRDSTFLLNLERELQEEFNIMLRKGKDNWDLKSKIDSLLWDDLNSKFHQTTTIPRRRNNKILALQNDLGDWIKGNDNLKDHIAKVFKKLYHIDMVCFFKDSEGFPTLRGHIDKEHGIKLSSIPFAKETKKPIFQLNACKSPRLNGFT
ncbi:hypothetical protein ACH5RR_008732 [Cinchona calisaya]|uniref:Uncharacterized protein n=1 Tax=Cinchona calisaya TaxID=153742 RepID=A0ABD3AG38_9GENT